MTYSSHRLFGFASRRWLILAAPPLLVWNTAAHAVEAASADAGTQAVQIQGRKDGYRSLSATGATKTDADIADLPQSVRVLPRQLIQDAGVTQLQGALDLSSGFARQSNLGGLWDSYAVRGFTGDPNFGSDYMVNGFNASRGYSGVRDVANTQTVEILKGPASALYGRGEPGGSVNVMTKKPLFQPLQSIELGVMSHDGWRVATDLSGPLSAQLAYRLNAVREHTGSARDFMHAERQLISPSFLWTPGEQTSVSYEMEANEQRTPFDRGVLAVQGRLGLVARQRFLGEPTDGDMRVRSNGHQLFVHHRLNEQWSLQGGISYRDSSLNGYSSEANNLLADGQSLRRQRRYRDFSATDRSGRVELLGQVSTGSLQHQLLFGLDMYRFDDSRIQLRRNPSASNPYLINIVQPVYGAQADALALSINTQEQQQAQALYLQDQISFTPQWKLLAGVRLDQYDQRVMNVRNAALNQQSLSATSPRVGMLYQLMPELALYINSARGFRPNSGVSIDNLAFPAERSTSHELGLKAESHNKKVQATLALYDIHKSNVLTTNPLNTDFSVAAGEVGSRGLELDVSGEIAERLQLSFAYAYTDARVTRGDKLIQTGSRLPNVAKHSASLFLKQGWNWAGYRLAVGAGAQYVGARAGDVAVSSDFSLPAYTSLKLMSTVDLDQRTQLSLQIDNLTDRSYYTSSYSQLWVTPGNPRQISAYLRHRF